jgi:LysR family transcriptional activator of glutamate synthase operon
LAGEHFVRLEDCKDERFLVNDSSFDRRAVIDNCKVVGFTPNITLCSNEPRIINEALYAGRGVSMVPANAFYEKYSDDSPIVALRFSDVEVFRFISIVSRKDRTLIEQPKKLYNFAINYFEQYGRTLQQFLDDYFPAADFGPRKSIGLNREENIGAPDPAIRDEG